MATIKCDICGGTLSMDVSGEFATCDFCGLKHDKDRLKVKVEELKKDNTQKNGLFD